jgi:hypothetical protein
MDMRGQLKLGIGRLTSRNRTRFSQQSPEANQGIETGRPNESALPSRLSELRISKIQIPLGAVGFSVSLA